MALAEIAAAVKTIDSMTNPIAIAVEEQSAGSQDINRNHVSVKQLAERTSADAQQTTHTVSELSGLAQELQAVVGELRA